MKSLACITVAAMILATPAQSHEWYPVTCCNERDCAPLADGDVVRNAEGYHILSLGVTVPYDKANSSPDARFHACTSGKRLRSIYSQQGPWMNRSPLCFFAPEGGV